MNESVSAWVWVACLGATGGAVASWSARWSPSRPVPAGPGRHTERVVDLGRLGHIAIGAATAAATAAAIAWMMSSAAPPSVVVGTRAVPEALAFLWIGFVTIGWLAAERDKRVLHRAVCSAAVAPAAHPDTVQALAHASPDAVYEAVRALVPPACRARTAGRPDALTVERQARSSASAPPA